MKIPIGILTYKRAEYLKRTLESFLDWNRSKLDVFPLTLLVQGGLDKETKSVIERYDSFLNKVLISKDNSGCAKGYNEVMGHVLLRETELVMHLQDDWESRDSLSKYIDEIVDLFKEHGDIGYIRLRAWRLGTRVCGQNRITRKGISYDKVTKNIAKTTAHFTLNPTIIRSSVLKQMLPISKELDAMHKYHSLDMKAAQLYANCFRHIGEARAQVKGTRWVK